MEIILHSAQYREMCEAVKGKIWGIRGKTGDNYVNKNGFHGFQRITNQ